MSGHKSAPRHPNAKSARRRRKGLVAVLQARLLGRPMVADREGERDATRS